MAAFNEADFDRALDSVIEETVDADDSVDSGDSDDLFESEELSDDDAPESEGDIEDVAEGDDDEGAVDDEAEAEESAATLFEWNGNPDELPSHVEHDGKVFDLTKTYKAMQAGFTKKMQEVAAARKRYEELTEQYQQTLQAQKKVNAQAADPRPSNPTVDMPEDAQEARWSEIQRWEARQAYQDMVAKGQIPDPEVVKAQMAQQQEAVAIQRRINLIHSQDGYSDEIEGEMITAAQSSPHWEAALKTDEGALALFEFVKNKKAAEVYKAKAAELENAKLKRASTSSSRATPKQSAQKKSAKSSAADRFANLGFDQTIDAIVDDAFGL